MGGAEFYTLIGVLATALVAYIGHRIMRPKIQAEARKADAEADDRIVARLYRHIDRLDAEVEDLRRDFKALQEGAAAERTTLEKENAKLRTEMSRLTRRVRGLEDIFKIHPLPPEMRAALEALDRQQ